MAYSRVAFLLFLISTLAIASSFLVSQATKCFYVDGTLIRELKNMESNGVPFPKNQPMRMYSSLWNADDWATRGGLVKTDWSKAPFTEDLDSSRNWILYNYMIYNYCTDIKRFPQGLPQECKMD